MKRVICFLAMAGFLPAMAGAQEITGSTLEEILKKIDCYGRRAEVLRSNKLQTRHLRGNLPAGHIIDLSSCQAEVPAPPPVPQAPTEPLVPQRSEQDMPARPRLVVTGSEFFLVLAALILILRRSWPKKTIPISFPIPDPLGEVAEHWGNVLRAERVLVQTEFGLMSLSKCPLCEEVVSRGRFKGHLDEAHPDHGRFAWEFVDKVPKR